MVAKRIRQLEKAVGARLFNRTTRSINLTSAGTHLHMKAGDLVAGFDEVVHSLKHQERELHGLIRVMAPTTLTMFYLGEAFSSFLREHPHVTLELQLVDRSVNPLEEGFDLAISGRSTNYEGVIDVPLCSAGPILCVSPEYLKRRGTPSHPRDLVEHDCLIFKPAGSQWMFQGASGMITVEAPPRMIADDNCTLLQAAKAGCGITIIPRYVAAMDLDANVLQVLLPEFPPQENWFRAYVPRRRHGLPRVKALIEWIATYMTELSRNSTSEERPIVSLRSQKKKI